MNLKGIVFAIGDTTTHGDKGFRKREMILEMGENPQYPQYIKIEFTQDKCNELDKLTDGQEVTVDINLRGRLYTPTEGKNAGIRQCFTTIEGWRVTASTTIDSLAKNGPALPGEDNYDPFA